MNRSTKGTPHPGPPHPMGRGCHAEGRWGLEGYFFKTELDLDGGSGRAVLRRRPNIKTVWLNDLVLILGGLVGVGF